MSDIADDWKAHKKERADKRESNLSASTQMLREAGIEFDAKNNGLHLIIKTERGVINFWPSTGLWSHAGTSRRGVNNLIQFVKGRRESPLHPT